MIQRICHSRSLLTDRAWRFITVRPAAPFDADRRAFPLAVVNNVVCSLPIHASVGLTVLCDSGPC